MKRRIAIFIISSLALLLVVYLVFITTKNLKVGRGSSELASTQESASANSIVRKAAVAGQFYPENTNELNSAINKLLQNTEVKGGEIEDQMLVKRFDKYFIFKQIPLKAGLPPYYLLVLKADPEFERDDVESFAQLLKEILYT